MSANTEAQGSGRGLEAMKWVVVVALLLVAIVGNSFIATLCCRCVRWP